MYTHYILGEYDPLAKMAYIYVIRGKRVSPYLIEDYEKLLFTSFECNSYEEMCNNHTCY